MCLQIKNVWALFLVYTLTTEKFNFKFWYHHYMYRYGIKAMWAFKNEKETAKTVTMPKKVRWLWPFHTPFLCPRTKRDLIDLFTYLCWINQWFEGNNIFLSWILTVFSTVKVRQCKDNGPSNQVFLLPMQSSDLFENYFLFNFSKIYKLVFLW